MQSILKVLIGFLLGVIVFEIFVLFFPSFIPARDTQDQFSRVVYEDNPEDPVFELRHYEDQAIDVSTLYSLSFVKAEVLAESVLNSKFEGIVKEVVNENGVRTRNGISYEYDFGFIIENNGKESNFYFQEKDRNKVKIVRDGTESNFSSLQNGDRVQMEYTMDLKKHWDDNILAITITIL